MLNTLPDQHSADEEAEIHRNAYNAAFYELGLSWYWDIDTHQALQIHAGEREQIRAYLAKQQSHLLKAYDADFLIDAIQKTKMRCHEAMTACGNRMSSAVNWAEIQRGEIGV
jgi:predicted heme/steroid binding protein